MDFSQGAWDAPQHLSYHLYCTTTQYQYNQATVYYLPAQCCDIMAILYDVQGDVFCYPDGGIAGTGDGQYDFHQKKTHEILIWQNEREVH